MNCPYCNEKMMLGLIHAEAGRPAFWLPFGRESELGLLSAKAVEKLDGFVLGEATKLGFLAKKKAMGDPFGRQPRWRLYKRRSAWRRVSNCKI